MVLGNSDTRTHHFDRFLVEQENIPGGCIPTAFLVWGGGVYLLRGLVSLGGCVAPVPKDHTPLRNMEPGTKTPLEGTRDQAARQEVTLYGDQPPPSRGQTDACENITLSQTSFAGVKNDVTQVTNIVNICKRRLLILQFFRIYINHPNHLTEHSRKAFNLKTVRRKLLNYPEMVLTKPLPGSVMICKKSKKQS